MGRKSTWRKRRRRLPRSARIFPAATLVPLVFAIGCLVGIARLRPVVAVSTGLFAASIGFLVGAALIQFGGKDASSHAADVGPFDLPLEAIEAAVAPPLVEPVRLPTEPGARPSVEQVVRVVRGDTLINLIVDVGVDNA